MSGGKGRVSLGLNSSSRRPHSRNFVFLLLANFPFFHTWNQSSMIVCISLIWLFFLTSCFLHNLISLRFCCYLKEKFFLSLLCPPSLLYCWMLSKEIKVSLKSSKKCTIFWKQKLMGAMKEQRVHSLQLKKKYMSVLIELKNDNRF